ncbi:hypothetical protein BH24CHL7_BH24CHL7_04330 [soil metagenome]
MNNADKTEPVSEVTLRGPQKRKLPRDVNQRAKLIVDMVLGEADPAPTPQKDPERVERGKLGGSKGGNLRAERLSPERRREIARTAAAARWSKTTPTE